MRFVWLLATFYLTITHIKAQSVGGTASGASTYCDTLNSGFISITGYSGNVTTWQQSINGGATWTNNGNTFTSQSYFNLKQTTCYRAIVKNGAFPADTSTTACVIIYLPTLGGTISGAGAFCVNSGSGTLNLVGERGNVLKWQYSTNGGSSWTNISNTTTAQSYAGITQNTIYEAVVQNTSFCLTDTSARAYFTIDALSVAGTITNAGNDSVCYEANANTLNLVANSGGVTGWIESINNGASWSPIANTTPINTSYDITQTTTYASIVKNGVCPADTTNYITIHVIPQNTVSAGLDSTITQGQSLVLTGAGSGSPNWSPSTGLDNPSSFTPNATPLFNTTYILTTTDSHSCINSDTVVITVTPLTFEGTISTVFTPNGDGINDNWYIEKIMFYPENEVAVYNIYGNEVFAKKNYNNDWQGTYNGAPLPDGTYYYVVKIDSKTSVYKGSLDILRNK